MPREPPVTRESACGLATTGISWIAEMQSIVAIRPRHYEIRHFSLISLVLKGSMMARALGNAFRSSLSRDGDPEVSIYLALSLIGRELANKTLI